MSVGPVRVYHGPCGEPGCTVQSLHGHAEATFPMNFISEEGQSMSLEQQARELLARIEAMAS